jgi:hypothetical protein
VGAFFPQALPAEDAQEQSGVRPDPARPPWAWATAALLISAVLLSPFLIVEVPAVLDYPNHLARLYILAGPGDPILSPMYAAQWSALPNIGMDLIGRALLRILPVHVAGRVLLALSLMAPPAGTALYARAAFGRWPWWSLGAAVIAFNGVFFLGFMNFLGLGPASIAVCRRRYARAGDPWYPPRVGGAYRELRRVRAGGEASLYRVDRPA